MARVSVLINNSPVKILETCVTREGERAIDQSSISLPACVSASVGDTVKILQDAVDLTGLKGAYMFQGNSIDESGRCNNSIDSISYPRIDTRLRYFNCAVDQGGIRDTFPTVTGSITSATGKVNTKAMCFDGINDYVTYDTESIFSIDQTTSMSTSMWIKTSDTCAPLIAKKAALSTGIGWEVALNCSGQVSFKMTNTGTTNEIHIRGDTSVNTCVWTHIAVTYTGIPTDASNSVVIWINGVEDTKGVVATTLTSTTLNCSNVTHGAYADGSSKYTGLMDDAAFWISRVLTSTQVRKMFQLGTVVSVSGRKGDAIRFNGVDAFYEVPYTTDYDFTGTFDIQTWIRWQGTSIGYAYARRTIAGNGFALSVNRLVAGDVVAEVDGNTLKTCGESFNDFNWHFIRVYRDTSDVVHLQVDNVEKNSVTVGSNLTLASPPLMIGTSHNRTAYFDGDIQTIRIYDRVLASLQISRLYEDVNSSSLMKFGGNTTKVTKNIYSKAIVVQSFGKQLGETEVRAQAYQFRSPEFIVDDLIRANTSLIPHIHGTCSGIILQRFNADGKLIDVVRDLVQLTGRTFNTDALGQFHMHDNEFNSTCFVFTHGLCVQNMQCVNDDTEIVNDLVVIGETKRYDTSQSFTGDGVTNSLLLTYGAISSTVYVASSRLIAEEDYTTCVLNKTIDFISVPACSAAISIEYQYEIPLLIRGEKSSSITENGRHSKRLVMPWIRTRNDGIRFINGYLNRYKSIRASLKVELGTMRNGINEGDVVRVVNSVKGIDDTFVVKSLSWKYPEMKTSMLVGEFKFDDLEYEKQIIEKLHDLESALTEIKDIRCSEQLEEVMTITHSTNVINAISNGVLFVETMALTDTLVITTVLPATYSTTFIYNGTGVYGTPQIVSGFMSSGFTTSGFTV